MKIRTKIIIDRLLGVSLCTFLDGIVYLAGKILPRNHSDDPTCVKTIVISKYLGFGSILQAIPMLTSLHNRYPSATIVIVTTKKNIPIVNRIPIIDRVLSISDNRTLSMAKDLILLLIALWRLKPDLYFDLEVYSSISTIIATLSCARNRYGFYRKSTTFRLGLHTHLVFFNTHRHISQTYLQLAYACGAQPVTCNRFRLSVKTEDKLGKKGLLTSLGLSQNTRYILVNPNASDLMLERRWPSKNVVKLLSYLTVIEKPILLIGSPNERPFVQSILDQLPPSDQKRGLCHNAAGLISLGGLLSLIKDADLLISNDSGPSHLSIVLGTPCVVLFGPVSPIQYGPYNSHYGFHKVIYKDIYCSPCLYHADKPPCNGDNQCMHMIAPEEVCEASIKLLRELMSPSINTKRSELSFSQAII